MGKTKIDIDKFIDAFEKEECLWNVILDQYKDKYLRQSAIERLGNSFEISGKFPVSIISLVFIISIHNIKKISSKICSHIDCDYELNLILSQ